MNPVVSVITPTYNRAHLLPRAWASLARQTECRFQWIIVDDGSTDNTQEVVQGFNDPRIVYVWQHNQGVNSARNRGDEEIQADYMVYLDSDDELLKETTLQEMLTEIQATRPEIAWVAFTVVVDDKRTAPPVYHMPPGERFESSYLDHVCEQKIWGEFFPIYRRDVLSLASWPPFNGMEALRHWRILKHRPALLINRPALLINRPARVYHRQEGNHLTGVESAVGRASDMAEATASLIDEHKTAWLKHCPKQLGKYHFYKAVYQALSVTGFRVMPDILKSITISIRFNPSIAYKAILLLLSLIFPLTIRQKLFLRYFWVKS